MKKLLLDHQRLAAAKREAAEMMILHMPPKVFEHFEELYQSTTWEKMVVNADTAGSKAWKPGHTDPQAKGPWKEVFHQSRRVH